MNAPLHAKVRRGEGGGGAISELYPRLPNHESIANDKVAA